MSAWVDFTIASRLIGLDPGLIGKRAALGKYGPVRIKGNDKFVSTLGLALASRHVITPKMIAAARADRPFPQEPVFEQYQLRRRVPSIDQIGATVTRAFHDDEEITCCK